MIRRQVLTAQQHSLLGIRPPVNCPDSDSTHDADRRDQQQRSTQVSVQHRLSPTRPARHPPNCPHTHAAKQHKKDSNGNQKGIIGRCDRQFSRNFRIGGRTCGRMVRSDCHALNRLRSVIERRRCRRMLHWNGGQLVIH